MRSFLINKNLCFYYWLRKRIGKEYAYKVANIFEKSILIFGRKTPFPFGVAILAMATGAPVLPVFVVMGRNRKYKGIIESPIYFNPSSRQDRETVIQEGMEKLIKKFEEYIEKYPDQWYNFYSYWNE